MQKERNIIVKTNADIAGAVALAERPAAVAAGFDTPPAFRGQERFWAEVKRRIVERRPGAKIAPDRLY